MGGGWRSALSALSHRISQTADQAIRASVNADIEDIRGALDQQLPELGRGAAFFACRERGIWRQIALPIPLPDNIRIGPRPYLRPLLRTWGRSDRMLLALLSREQSRFFVSHLGTIEEIYRVKGQRIRGMLTDRVPRDRREALATQLMKDEAKALASMTEIIGREFETTHILLCAPPDMSAAFRDHLSMILLPPCDVRGQRTRVVCRNRCCGRRKTRSAQSSRGARAYRPIARGESSCGLNGNTGDLRLSERGTSPHLGR